MKKLTYNFLLLAGLVLIIWQAPHYLTIRDVTTFRVVLALGLFQTVVAIYGGYLAVLALGSEERPPHEIAFFILGILLFCLTFYVGVLNDATQYEVQRKLNDSVGWIQQMKVLLPTLKPCDPTVVATLQSYADNALLAAKHRPNSSNPTAPVAPPPSAPPQSAPAPTQSPTATVPAFPKPRPLPTPDPGLSPVNQLRNEIRDVSDQINSLDGIAIRQYDQIGNRLVKDAQAKGLMKDTGPIPSDIELEIILIDGSETTTYQTAWLPVIMDLRTKAHQYLTAEQIATDESNFSNINYRAMTPNHPPRNSTDLFYNMNKRLGGISAYLQNLTMQMR